MALKSGEIPLGYNTSPHSHTFHTPTFIYVTANENSLKLQHRGMELATFFNQPHPLSLWFWTSHTYTLYDFELATPPCSKKANLELKNFFLKINYDNCSAKSPPAESSFIQVAA